MAEKALPASIKAAVDRILAAMDAAKAKKDWTPIQHSIMLDLACREAYGVKVPKSGTPEALAFRKASDQLRADLSDGRVQYCSNMRKLILGPEAKEASAAVSIE